jgi:hypothetical protein
MARETSLREVVPVSWIAAGLLAAGAIFATAGALLITGAIRRSRAGRPKTV